MRPYVVSRAFAPLVQQALERGLDTRELLDGLSFDHDELGGSLFRLIPWNEFALYCHRLADAAGMEVFEELGDALPQTEGFSPFYAAGKLLFEPRWLFQFVFRVFGPMTFPAVESQVRDLGPDSGELTLRIPDELDGCLPYFVACNSALRTLGVPFGMPPAVIKARMSPREATYQISYPPSGSLLTHLRRTAAAILTPNFLGEELIRQHHALFEHYEELRRTESGLRSLIEHSPDGVLIAREAKILYANPALVSFLKYARAEDLIGKSLMTVCADSALLNSATAPIGQGANPWTLAFIDRMGQAHPAEITTFEAFFEGQPVNVSLVRDATIKNQMLSQALEMDRVLAMGTIATGVAHEINNPLSFVLTNLAFLKDAIGDAAPELLEDEDVHEALKSTIGGVEQIANIAQDLKDFSRTRRDRVGPVSARDVINRAVKMSQHDLRNRASLHFDFRLKEPLSSDPHRLGQVILNLLLNALQAIEPGASDENRITITTRREDDWAVIEIIDTGRGISPVDMAHVFEPFYTTKSEDEGTGMGLFICREIIERHGGVLELHSPNGEGTRAVITLPLARD